MGLQRVGLDQATKHYFSWSELVQNRPQNITSEQVISHGLQLRALILKIVKNLPHIPLQEQSLQNRGDTHMCIDFPAGSAVKNPPASAGAAGDVGSIPGLGSSPRGGNGNPLQYSCLVNPMDRRSCWATVHGVTKNRTQLSDSHFVPFYFTPYITSFFSL